MLYDRWIKNWKSALAENFFLRSAVLLLGVGLILNATVLREETKIVVVPPTLTNEFWLERNRASETYIEQMAVFVATLAGNLSPRSAEYNVDALLKYMEPTRMIEVRDDLKAQAEYIKKNNIAQSYHPSGSQIDIDKQSAVVEGTVVRHVGSIKVSEEKMAVHMKFKLSDYFLRVTDLYVEYPDREKKPDLAAKDKAAGPPELVGGDPKDLHKEEKIEDKK